MSVGPLIRELCPLPMMPLRVSAQHHEVANPPAKTNVQLHPHSFFSVRVWSGRNGPRDTPYSPHTYRRHLETPLCASAADYSRSRKNWFTVLSLCLTQRQGQDKGVLKNTSSQSRVLRVNPSFAPLWPWLCTLISSSIDMECPNHKMHILSLSGKYKSSNATGLYPLCLFLVTFAGNVLSSGIVVGTKNISMNKIACIPARKTQN